MSTDTVACIKANAKTIAAQAKKIDTSNTQTVKMSDLREGDVVIKVGTQAFPFPFTMSSVKVFGKVVILNATHGWFNVTPVILNATHGWFNVTPYPAGDVAVIVAR